MIDKRSLDLFVTKVVNRCKEDTENIRQQILFGDLTLEDYRREAGILQGTELAMQVLMEEAKELIRREMDYV